MTTRKAPPSPAQAPRRGRGGGGLDSLISAPVRIEIPNDRAAEHSARPAPRPPAGLQSTEQQPAASQTSSQPASMTDPSLGEIQFLPVHDIMPNRQQPRQQFDEAALDALAESIRTDGLMQPIIVRRAPVNSQAAFELIAGERRWRAAQRIGLERLPAFVRAVDDRTATELALIENLQREDLNPIERAEAFQYLAHQYGLTHEQIGARVGLDRATISNLIRLNNLDMFTRNAVRDARLSLGHARALLAIAADDRREAMARRTVQLGWSVRELERRLQQESSTASSTSSRDRLASAHMRDLETRLGEHLGTKVRIHAARKKGAGRLVIEFFSLDQFEGLIERMGYRGEDST